MINDFHSNCNLLPTYRKGTNTVRLLRSVIKITSVVDTPGIASFNSYTCYTDTHPLTDNCGEMEEFETYTHKALHRSLSFVSISAENQNDDSEQFEFRRRVHTSATSLDKPKQRVRPRPYHAGSSKRKDRALKDGFVWMQIVPHMRKSWQLRYFMVFKDKVCYLEEPITSRSKGMEWKEIRPSDIVSVKIPNDVLLFSSNQSSYMVSLKTNSRISRTKILLRFKTQEERDEWITAFLMAKSCSLMDEKK